MWTGEAISTEGPPSRGDEGGVRVRLVGVGEAEEEVVSEGRGNEESEAMDTLQEGGEEGDEGGLTCLKLSGSLECVIERLASAPVSSKVVEARRAANMSM